MRRKRRAALVGMKRVIERTKATSAAAERPRGDVRLEGGESCDRASAQRNQARIDKWIRDRLIDWPPTSCLHCRKPIVPGRRWTVVANGEAVARFHQPCHAEWRTEREAAARQALGLEG
jgi:hypothetical protein